MRTQPSGDTLRGGIQSLLGPRDGSLWIVWGGGRVARVSWALYLYFASMAHFEDQLRSLQ
jgi:hypothetical protein